MLHFAIHYHHVLLEKMPEELFWIVQKRPHQIYVLYLIISHFFDGQFIKAVYLGSTLFNSMDCRWTIPFTATPIQPMA